MRTHIAIIDDAGGYKGLAGKLGLPEARVRFWSRRGSIPAEMWRAVSHHRLATLEELAAAAEARAVSETHTPTKEGEATKPDSVHVEDIADAATPERAEKSTPAKSEAAA